jgi:hypothetical protein
MTTNIFATGIVLGIFVSVPPARTRLSASTSPMEVCVAPYP